MGTLILLAAQPAADVHAQGGRSAGSGSESRIEGKYKFLPIPYLNYTRSIGLQLGALPMLMFNPSEADTISPSSMAGLFGMYATNKTWFVTGFAVLYLDEDNWRVTTAGGTGNYNFQFYMDAPISSWIPYQTELDFAFVKLQRRLYKRLYGGLSYIYLYFITTLEEIPDPSQTTLHGLGFDLSLDRRSSVYYPRTGFLTTLQYFTYPSALGNETESDKIEYEYNHYVPIRRDQDVIAGRFFAGMGLGDLAFEQQFIVGQRKDIRGYTQGEYRGNYMLALQGEYRWNFHPRLSAVGFAGVATVFESVNEDHDGKLLPGIGAGFRFTADTETHMNVGMDVAVGLDDWGIYFRFGELF
jgi:outer membrane protein assembly factor BamA